VTDFDLGTVPLFAELSGDDLARLSEGITEVQLGEGQDLFSEGDDADMAYVIAEGELEILKESADQRVRIAVSGAGDVVGEMALLTGESRNAGARAITPVRLISIPRSCLEDVLSTSVEANRALFSVFIARWREQESRIRQSERMAQIGVLTAGLAHEMNNPAAAVTSGSKGMGDGLSHLLELARSLPDDLPLPDPSQAGVIHSAMEQADAEESIGGALTALGISDPWQKAANLASAGYTADDLRGLDPIHAENAIAYVAESSAMISVLSQVAEGSKRLSELVGALKSYSFLDQAPVQEVDVVKGIEDTLLILRSKTKDIVIDRDFAQDLPTIVAYGSQLNQVWTNLIDNAADAITEADAPDATITIRTRHEEDCIIVTVENNGPAIPDGVIDRIFEAFYTTKEPGKGTGLGLDTAYSIVVTQHRGSMTVSSDDENTVFTVTLPITQESE